MRPKTATIYTTTVLCLAEHINKNYLNTTSTCLTKRTNAFAQKQHYTADIATQYITYSLVTTVANVKICRQGSV